jgi:hypothetical protein
VTSPLPTLVTADAYAARFSLTAPAVGDPERPRWDNALLDASGALRDVIRQPLSAGTATLPVKRTLGGYFLIPLCPVTALIEVSNDDGVVDPSLYRWSPARCQRLWVDPSVISVPCCFDGDGPELTVTVDYGYDADTLPDEVARWGCVLAAGQIAATKRGNLGSTGGLTSLAIDDGKATFAGGADEIPERVKERLRASYGGEA